MVLCMKCYPSVLEIEQLEINPFLVATPGRPSRAVDVRVLLSERAI
jgi:hypothetical protein